MGVTPWYLNDMTLAYIVASIYLRSGWWVGLVLVGLVCGGGVHRLTVIRRRCSCGGKSIRIAAASDMITYLCAGFSSLASLVLCFSPPEAKVRLEAD